MTWLLLGVLGLRFRLWGLREVAVSRPVLHAMQPGLLLLLLLLALGLGLRRAPRLGPRRRTLPSRFRFRRPRHLSSSPRLRRRDGRRRGQQQQAAGGACTGTVPRRGCGGDGGGGVVGLGPAGGGGRGRGGGGRRGGGRAHACCGRLLGDLLLLLLPRRRRVVRAPELGLRTVSRKCQKSLCETEQALGRRANGRVRTLLRDVHAALCLVVLPQMMRWSLTAPSPPTSSHCSSGPKSDSSESDASPPSPPPLRPCSASLASMPSCPSPPASSTSCCCCCACSCPHLNSGSHRPCCCRARTTSVSQTLMLWCVGAGRGP